MEVNRLINESSLHTENYDTEEKDLKELSPEELEKIKEKYYKMYMRGHTPWIKEEEPGRNDLCPCGSGKKYKKCCYGKVKSSYTSFGETFSINETE